MAKRKRKTLLIGLAILALVVFGTLMAFAPRSFTNPSPSMLPTIYPEEQFWGSVYPYLTEKPKRGDIVVFKSPRDPGVLFVKRVVGIPGDRVEFSPRLKVNDVAVIGESLDTPVPDLEQYGGELGTKFSLSLYKAKLDDVEYQVIDQKDPSPYSDPVTVPEGKIFVVGDLIPNSYDSRHFGTVATDSVVAKATRILWGKDRFFEPIK